MFFRCYVLLPEVKREKDVHVKNDLNYWFILLKLMYQMMFVLRCIKEYEFIIYITIHTCNAKKSDFRAWIIPVDEGKGHQGSSMATLPSRNTSLVCFQLYVLVTEMVT